MSMKPYTNFLFVLFFASFCGKGGLFGEDQKLPNEVHWMRESKEYQNLCRQIYRQAEEKISQQAKQEQGKLAVVIDLGSSKVSSIEIRLLFLLLEPLLLFVVLV